EAAETVTETLITQDDDKLIYTYSYINASPQNDVTFNYTLNGLDDIVYNSLFGLCYDCRYLLEFSVEAPDGSMVDLKDFSTSIVDVDLDAQLPASTTKLLQFTIEPDACSNGNGYDAGSIEFKADFTNIGTYIVRKKLRVLAPDFEGLR